VGSSKRVKLHGTFIAKAGFDLRKGLSIDIRPNEIMVQLPHAQILGVEQQQVDVLAFENGLWNRISGQDVQSELSVLPELAWKKAAESELTARSRGNFAAATRTTNSHGTAAAFGLQRREEK
jgi:hypothetical protein